MPALSKIPSYRKFINDRDRVLEVFQRNCQKEISDITYDAFKHILFTINHRFRMVNDHTRFTSHGRMIIDSIGHETDAALRHLAHSMLGPIKTMRRLSVNLAVAAEFEAINRVIKHAVATPRRMRAPKISDDTSQLEARLYADLTRVRNKITNAVESGYVNKSTVDKVYDRVVKVLPKVKRFKVPPKELKPLREATTPDDLEDSATLDFMSDSEWRELIDQYKNEYIPKHRNLSFDAEIGEPELEEWYGWEIENAIADDFVNQIKDGQIDAANQAGISDLMWVAILDDKTRPEHRLKDGLTSSEIDAKLNNEWADFEDDSIVAPGGDNCRCRSVPFVPDLPEAPEVNYGDFDQWLNS